MGTDARALLAKTDAVLAQVDRAVRGQRLTAAVDRLLESACPEIICACEYCLDSWEQEHVEWLLLDTIDQMIFTRWNIEANVLHHELGIPDIIAQASCSRTDRITHQCVDNDGQPRQVTPRSIGEFIETIGLPPHTERMLTATWGDVRWSVVELNHG